VSGRSAMIWAVGVRLPSDIGEAESDVLFSGALPSMSNTRIFQSEDLLPFYFDPMPSLDPNSPFAPLSQQDHLGECPRLGTRRCRADLENRTRRQSENDERVASRL
jgi:hypothetical protein